MDPRINALNMVKENGANLQMCLQYVDDEEIVMAAVSNFGLALNFASDRLKNNTEIVMAAVKQNGKAIKYANERFIHNKQMVVLALQHCNLFSINELMDSLDEDLKDDPEVEYASKESYDRQLRELEEANKISRK